MILDIIIGFISTVFGFILSWLPIFDFGIGTAFSDFNIWITDILNDIHYFLPLTGLLTILGLKLAIHYNHAIYKLVMRIWDSLPFT